MGLDMPDYVHHAALNAACMVRTELVSIAQDDDALQARFSKSLSSAAHINESTTSSNLDLSIDGKWDLCYLRLLCALSQNPAWHNHLKQHGHFDRCLTIALTVANTRKKQKDRWYFAAYGVFITHILTTMDGKGVFMEPGFSQAAQVYQSWPFSLESLYFVFSFTFFMQPDKLNWEVISSTGYHEALPYLVRYAETWDNKEEMLELIILVKQVSKLLEINPVGNTEVRDLGMKIRRLLYTFLKKMGMNFLHTR